MGDPWQYFHTYRTWLSVLINGFISDPVPMKTSHNSAGFLLLLELTEKGSVASTHCIPVMTFILNIVQWNLLFKHAGLFCYICHLDINGEAHHRFPENWLWGLLSLQLWELLVGSDNGFPLHWATTQHNTTISKTLQRHPHHRTSGIIQW